MSNPYQVIITLAVGCLIVFALMFFAYNKGYAVAEAKGIVALAEVSSQASQEIHRQQTIAIDMQSRLTELEDSLEAKQKELSELAEQAELEAQQDEHRDRTCLSEGAAKRIGGIK